MTGARVRFVALALATIVVGLLVHRGGVPLPGAARDVAGDALWAMMIAWWVGAILPGAPMGRRAGAALGICALVEASQLYHSPVLDGWRQTVPGHLVLGSDFDPRDLAAYAAGVLAAWWLERRARPAGIGT